MASKKRKTPPRGKDGRFLARRARKANPIAVGLKPGKGSKMKAPRKRPPPAVKAPVDLSSEVAALMAIADTAAADLRFATENLKMSPRWKEILSHHARGLAGAVKHLHALLRTEPGKKRPKVVRTNPKGRKWFPAGRQVINPKGEPARRLELMVDAYSFHSVIEALGVIAAKKAAATRKAQPGLSQMFDDISDHILASTFRLSDIVEREV